MMGTASSISWLLKTSGDAYWHVEQIFQLFGEQVPSRENVSDNGSVGLFITLD